jgi:hypothetical protein
LVLRLFGPASAYFVRKSPLTKGLMYRGAVRYGPNGGSPLPPAEPNASHTRAAGILHEHGTVIDVAARTLARTGRAKITLEIGWLDARVRRFWRGDSILEIRYRSATRAIGTSIIGLPGHRAPEPDLLADHLTSSLANLDRPWSTPSAAP